MNNYRKKIKSSDQITIVKCDTSIPYTIIPNYMLGNVKMGFESKGLLSFLLSLPMSWTITKSWIMKNFLIKRKMLDKCFLELEENGYLIITSEQRRDESGYFKSKLYKIYPYSKKYDQADHSIFNRCTEGTTD